MFCGVPLSRSRREKCFQPDCPCYGTRAGSQEMATAASRAMTRPYSQRGGGNVTGAELAALLDELFPDPVETKARSYARARSASITAPTITGAEALARVTELRAVP